MYEALAKKVAISVGKKDGIITISVDDKNPKRSADIANAYVEELGKLIVRYNLESIGRTRVFIEQQLAKTKVALVSAETDLKNFQAKHKIYDVSGQVSASIGEVGRLRAQLAVQEAQYAMLRAQYTDSVQEVRSVKATIEKLRAQIATQEGSSAGSSIPTVGSVPALGEEYVRLLREFKVQEALNEVLTKQYEMAKLSEAKQLSTIQVIHNARVPDKSIKPSRRKTVMLYTALGFLLAVSISICLNSIQHMDAGNKLHLQRFQALCRKLISFNKNA